MKKYIVLLFFVLFSVTLASPVLAAKGIIKNSSGDGGMGGITTSDLGITDIGTLPTSGFYFLKEWRRNISRFFTFNPVAKVELELEITNEKAAETLKVQETKPDDTEALATALENYTKAAEQLQTQFTKLKETSENPNVEKLLEKLNEQILKHADLFSQLTANVINPQGARDNHLQGAVDIAQKKVQELVIIATEKDKNIEQKAIDQIKRADIAIHELESELAEFAINEPGVPNNKLAIKTKGTGAQKMKAGLETASGKLANAKTAFAEGKYGEAFGQARAAEVLARDALKIIREGSDVDAPRIEDARSGMPVVPGTDKTGEKIVPEAEKRVFLETNNRTACDDRQAPGCLRGEILECHDGKWACIGPATGNN